jgi:hypothetical protein
MRALLSILLIFIFLPNPSFSGEYSDLLKRSKTKNSNKLLKVIDETIKGLEVEMKIVKICYQEMKIVNGDKKNKTINEVKKCEPLVDRYNDYIDLTKIYENDKFGKKLEKIWYKIQDGKIKTISLKDFDNKINRLSNAASEIENLYTKIRLLDPRE